MIENSMIRSVWAITSGGEEVTLQVMNNMNFAFNSRTHLPGCGALAKSSTSSNLSQKGIPMFSSSPENLILKIKKGLYKKRRKNIELLSSNQLFKVMKNISIKEMQFILEKSFQELKISSFDNQNEKRRNRKLSDCYVDSQIAIFKPNQGMSKNEEGSFYQGNEIFTKNQQIIELKNFWDQNHHKIILYGRAGIGKVFDNEHFLFLYFYAFFIFILIVNDFKENMSIVLQ